MKKLFFLFAAVALLSACSNNNKTNSSDVVADEKKCESISVDSFLVVAHDFVGKELTVKGTVDHVCKHGGKRINVFTNDPNVTIHGEASESVGSFEVELEGSDVCITGTVLETRIDMAYVDEWETKVKEQIAEEGEDADVEHVESVDHHAKLDEIQEYRDKIEASENGYLAFYDLEVTKYHECDVKADSNSDGEELEEHDHDHDDDGEHEHEHGEDHE